MRCWRDAVPKSRSLIDLGAQVPHATASCILLLMLLGTVQADHLFCSSVVGANAHWPILAGDRGTSAPQFGL